MDILIIEFSTRFNYKEKNFSASIVRLDLSPVQYVVTISDRHHFKDWAPIIFIENSITGSLEHTVTLKDTALLDIIKKKIRMHCKLKLSPDNGLKKKPQSAALKT